MLLTNLLPGDCILRIDDKVIFAELLAVMQYRSHVLIDVAWQEKCLPTNDCTIRSTRLRRMSKQQDILFRDFSPIISIYALTAANWFTELHQWVSLQFAYAHYDSTSRKGHIHRIMTDKYIYTGSVASVGNDEVMYSSGAQLRMITYGYYEFRFNIRSKWTSIKSVCTLMFDDEQ